jgi:ketosteroid isomerase-like protein
MTAEQAADVVRRGYHAFNTGDLDLFTTISADDFTWETPGKSPVAGLRKGRGEVYPHYGTYLNGSNGTFKAELQYVTANDKGQVVGVHRNTASATARRSIRCAASPSRLWTAGSYPAGSTSSTSRTGTTSGRDDRRPDRAGGPARPACRRPARLPGRCLPRALPSRRQSARMMS